MIAPDHLLIHSCAIERATGALDVGGAPTTTYALEYSGVPCRVVVRSGTEAPQYGGERNKYTYSVYFRGTQDVLETDRIIVEGLTLDVQSVIDFDLVGALKCAECERTA